MEEVGAVNYFKVTDVDSSVKFLPALPARLLAFLRGDTEGNAIDYLDAVGSERLSSEKSYY